MLREVSVALIAVVVVVVTVVTVRKVSSALPPPHPASSSSGPIPGPPKPDPSGPSSKRRPSVLASSAEPNQNKTRNPQDRPRDAVDESKGTSVELKRLVTPGSDESRHSAGASGVRRRPTAGATEEPKGPIPHVDPLPTHVVVEQSNPLSREGSLRAPMSDNGLLQNPLIHETPTRGPSTLPTQVVLPVVSDHKSSPRVQSPTRDVLVCEDSPTTDALPAPSPRTQAHSADLRVVPTPSSPQHALVARDRAHDPVNESKYLASKVELRSPRMSEAMEESSEPPPHAVVNQPDSLSRESPSSTPVLDHGSSQSSPTLDGPLTPSRGPSTPSTQVVSPPLLAVSDRIPCPRLQSPTVVSPLSFSALSFSVQPFSAEDLTASLLPLTTHNPSLRDSRLSEDGSAADASPTPSSRTQSPLSYVHIASPSSPEQAFFSPLSTTSNFTLGSDDEFDEFFSPMNMLSPAARSVTFDDADEKDIVDLSDVASESSWASVGRRSD